MTKIKNTVEKNDAKVIENVIENASKVIENPSTTQKTTQKNEDTVEKTENTVEKTENTVEKKNSTVEKIIALIMHNPQITVKEISSLLNITRRGIEEQIKTLKSKGLIRRVGPDKGGYWEVI